MNTQLIRLEAPYNLICGRGNSYHSIFGLHIATLIVVSDRENIDNASNSSMVPVIHSYPIVNNDGKPDGEVWLETELKDCMVVGRQGATIGLYTYKRVMEFFHNHGEKNMNVIPFILDASRTVYGLKLKFPGETEQGLLTKWDYVVNLIFDEDDDDTYIVYNDKKAISSFLHLG